MNKSTYLVVKFILNMMHTTEKGEMLKLYVLSCLIFLLVNNSYLKHKLQE